MKALIFLSVFVLWASIGQAQEITKLDEVKVKYSPLNPEITQNGSVFTIKIKPSGVHEFVKNPIGFLNENFDIHKFINMVGIEKYESYSVELRSSKGFMLASYDGEGNLISTRQNFKNILMPRHLRLQVYNSHKGWNLNKNKYIASTKGIVLDKAVYKLTLKNGNQKRNITLDALDKDYGVVANN
ncbi:MAG: hypothetical protein WA749_01950 [Gelidibacter sp.]